MVRVGVGELANSKLLPQVCAAIGNQFCKIKNCAIARNYSDGFSAVGVLQLKIDANLAIGTKATCEIRANHDYIGIEPSSNAIERLRAVAFCYGQRIIQLHPRDV